MHYVVGIYLLAAIGIIIATANVREFHFRMDWPWVLGILGNLINSCIAGYAIWISYWGPQDNELNLPMQCFFFALLEAATYMAGFVVRKENIEKPPRKYNLIMLLINAVAIIVTACFIYPLLLG